MAVRCYQLQHAQQSEKCVVTRLFKTLGILTYFIGIHIQCSRLNIENLNQQTAQSIMNNHLPFMLSLLHVSAST